MYCASIWLKHGYLLLHTRPQARWLSQSIFSFVQFFSIQWIQIVSIDKEYDQSKSGKHPGNNSHLFQSPDNVLYFVAEVFNALAQHPGLNGGQCYLRECGGIHGCNKVSIWIFRDPPFGVQGIAPLLTLWVKVSAPVLALWVCSRLLHRAASFNDVTYRAGGRWVTRANLAL